MVIIDQVRQGIEGKNLGMFFFQGKQGSFQQLLGETLRMGEAKVGSQPWVAIS
jgi:hypothetical protein